MTNLLDAKSIICLDVILGDMPSIRHDVCAFEDNSGLDSILQCCIEFVLLQPQSFFQMEKHESGWKITVENWEKKSRLLVTHYDNSNKPITWKTVLAQQLGETEIHYNSEVVKHFEAILGDSEFVEDRSKIPYFTRQIYEGAKLTDTEVIEQTSCPSVTTFAKLLMAQLGSQQSLWFRVEEYPYFEIQSTEIAVRYWLVKKV
jgi:hypothetical protein